MNVLTGYIVREVLKGSLVALLLLLTLFNLFTFRDELKELGTGNYGLKEIALYLLFTSPRVLYELIPSSALLGSLFVMGSMANHREIVAMRSIGLSIFWIVRSVMLAGMVLVVFSVFVGEFIAPEAERTAQIIKNTAKNDQKLLQSRYGLWLREENQFINVRQINGKRDLADIFIYEKDENGRLISMSHMAEAEYQGNALWHLKDIAYSELAKDRVFSEKRLEQEWQTAIDPDLLNVVVVKSDNMSLYDLFMYIHFLKENNQKAKSFELAFWGRLVNPLVTLVMLTVSIPFVLGVKRGVSAGGRIMSGIILGMTFNIFDQIIGHLGLVYEMNPALMAVLPALVVLIIACYAINRVTVA